MVKPGGLSRGSFYRNEKPSTTKVDRDRDLRDAIQRIALEWPCYGRPRIMAELKRQGWKLGPKWVLRLLRQDNLLCVRKRKFVVNDRFPSRPQGLPHPASQSRIDGSAVDRQG
jgi:hypothetical protein